MKTNLFFLTILSVFLYSCSSTQKINQNILNGNYDIAFSESLDKIQRSRKLEKISQTIKDLETSFAKANERDLLLIEDLKINKPDNYLFKIFEIYQKIDDRQLKIRDLQNLTITNENRKINVKLADISNEMGLAKKNAFDFLYQKSLNNLKNANKLEARTIYYDLEYLAKNSDNYDTKKYLEIAKNKGTDYVLVRLLNNSEKVIPRFLELDMLFSDYILEDEMWTKFDVIPEKNTHYDFGVELSYDRIEISPERIKEIEIQRARMVKDGKTEAKSDSGETIKDKDGKTIYIDTYKEEIEVKRELYQYKEAFIDATVNYFDFEKNKIIAEFPLRSNYVFKNSTSEVRFPKDELMIKSCSEDLKSKFRKILLENELRSFSK